jgi:DNA-binding MarR family transcriptional regulator
VTSNPSPSTKLALALECIEVLSELAGLFEERRRQLAESVGLTVGQWEVLELIQTEHFMPSMFAQKRASSAAAVSKILRQLTDKELIESSVAQTDGRKRDYRVTDAGQRILSKVRAERQLAIDEVWLKMTREELSQFSNVGGRLAARLGRWAEDQRSSSTKKGNENGQDTL